MVKDGTLPDVSDTAVSTDTTTRPPVLLCDTRDAAGPLHDEPHLHVREAVLFSLGTPFVCCSHVQVEA